MKSPVETFGRIGLVIAIAVAVGLGFGTGTPALEAQQGPPDLEELHDRLLPLFELNGVVFTDADETTDRLVVGVTNRGVARSVEQRLPVLGISPQTVDIVLSPPIVQMDTLRDRVRPLAGGLQIRFGNYLCTLGFNAERAGVQGFVTNSHCTNSQGGVEGTEYYQPLDQIPADFIGTEIADPLYTGSNCNGHIFPVGGKVCRWSDSAFVERAGGVTADFGYIARTSSPNSGSCPGSCEIVGQFRITGETTLGVGDTGNKVGRTTGWTQAPVTRTCVHTSVSGTNIIQLCQTFIEANTTLVGGGDSGSPVFEIVGGDDIHLAGLLWGGSTDGTLIVFSPLANIERSDTELGPLTTVASGGSDPGNTAPVADAGPDQNVTTGSSVDLDGTGSSDVDGNTLTFSWQFTSKPADSSATLSGFDTATPSFTADFDGNYVVELTVSDGEFADTDTVTVSASTVVGSPTDMHVGDLDGNGTSQGSTWTANVIITIHDGSHNLVSNATVNGSWSGGASGSASCLTNGNGQCTVNKGNIPKRNGSTTFTISDVTHGTMTYDSTANHDPDGDSNGTSITVSKP